jgi:Ca2+-binding RTX toxin-like protein
MNMVNFVIGTVFSDNDMVQGGVLRPSLNGVWWDSNRIYGYQGNDVERGAGFGDTLYGHGGSDTQYGYGGNDIIYGDSAIGINTFGVDGGDYQYGGDGNDSLYGHGGNDHLWGNANKDNLFGGLNSDTFHFIQGDSNSTAAGADTIWDWNAVDDSIDMPITGNAANYAEHNGAPWGVNDIATAKTHADVFHAGLDTYVFLWNAGINTGFLVADLDGNNDFETGVILAGAGAAAALNWADII